MNITRHNYEAFFLLYVDKELSAADRKAVESFVKENPDLQMELSLLQQTVVHADDIVLQKKDWLLREEEISALQENILLYADDELGAADKNIVESLLKTDATAKLEWNILQQTKLQPDTSVIFADKALLYRKEGGRVTAFAWWRVAAAALILGFGLWAGISVYNSNFLKTKDSGDLANENKIKPVQQKNNLPVVEKKQPATTLQNETAENSTVSTGSPKNVDPVQNVKVPGEKINNQSAITPQQNTAVQNSKKPDNNLPKPSLQNINSNGSNEVLVQNVLPSNSNSSRVSGNNDAVAKINPKENKINIEDVNVGKTDPNIAAIQVVNTNKTAEEENNNRYLSVDNKEKRTALGGFIRKAKRMLERTTNVKTGEGIKIAGFEIALK
jgi:hypothetical protein